MLVYMVDKHKYGLRAKMEAKDLSVFTVGKRFMGEYMVEHVVPFFNGELAISKAFDESYFLQLIHLERTVTTIEFERIRRLYEETDHPLLIPFYDLFLEKNALIIVYPYQPLQLLPEVVSRSGVDEEQIIRWIKDLIDLEIYLRSQSIPMFYVKDPRNVGLNAQGELKILYSGVDEVTPYPLDLNWGSFVYSIMSGQFLESSLQKMPSKHTLSRPMARLVQKCFKAKSLMSMQAHFEQYLNRKEGKGFLAGLFGGIKKENSPSEEAKVQEPQTQETEVKPVKQELLLTEPTLDPQGFDEPYNQSSQQTSYSQHSLPQEQTQIESPPTMLPPQTEAQTHQEQADYLNTAPPSQPVPPPVQPIESPPVEQNEYNNQETNSFTRKPFNNNPTITEEEWAVVENAYQSQQPVVDDDTKIFQPNNQTIAQESDEEWLKELNITQEELDQLVSQHQSTQEPLPPEWEQLDVNSYDSPSNAELTVDNPTVGQDDLDLAEGPIIDWSQVDPQQTASESSYQTTQQPSEQISQSFDEIENSLSVDHEALSLNQEQSFQAPTEVPDTSLQNLDALLAEMQILQQDLKESTSSDEVIEEEPEVKMASESGSMPNEDELSQLAEQFDQIFRDVDRYLDDYGPHHVVSATISPDLEKEIQTTYEQASATAIPKEENRTEEQTRSVEQGSPVEPTEAEQQKSVHQAPSDDADPLDRIRQEFAEKQRQAIEEQRLRFEEHKKQLIAKAEAELKQHQQKIQQEMVEQEKLILQQLEHQLKEQEQYEEQAIEEMRLKLEQEMKEQERLEKQKMAFAQLREQHEREEAEELQAIREKYEQTKKEQLMALAEERAAWEKREQERLQRERQKFAEREAALIEELEQQLAVEEQEIKERRAEQWKQLMEEREMQTLETSEPPVEQQSANKAESDEDSQESKEESKEESVGQELAKSVTEEVKEEKAKTSAEQASAEEQKANQTAPQKRKRKRRRRRKKKKKTVETGEPLEESLQDDELAELKRLEEEQKRLEEMAQQAQHPVSEGTS